MNGAFVHLAVNHVPVVGVPIGVLLLLAGLIRGSKDLIQSALVLWLILAAISVVALKSGGPAAHMIFGLPGIERGAIHEHAAAAHGAMRGVIILVVLSLVTLWFSNRSEGAPKWLLVISLLWGLAMTYAFGRVAHLGGLIRHPEIASDYMAAVPNAPPPAAPMAH